MSIVIFDTETTGLLAPIAAGHEYQPHLVELSAIKLSMVNDFEVLDRLYLRCKPPIEIPLEAIRVHHITNEDVVDCKPFEYYFNEIADFFTGSRILVGHNLLYDKNVIWWELVRMGKTMNFPWSIRGICTAETSMQYKGFRNNLTDLHTDLFGVGYELAHTAVVDCEVTMKCFVEMVKRGMIVL
jgi:DNA polymerase III epsilon subunit-like protein